MSKRRMFKTLAAGIVAAAFAAPASAGVLTLSIDPDGPGPLAPINNVTAMDWFFSSALARGGIEAIGPGLNNEFSVFAHSSLTSLNVSGQQTPVPFPNSIEWTEIFGMRERVVAVGTDLVGNPSAAFAFVPNHADNFLEIYFDDTPDADTDASDGAAGAGHSNGRLILRAIPTGFQTSSFTILSGGGIGNPLDQAPSGDDDYATANGGLGQHTVNGTGQTSTIGASVVFVDPAFFQLFDDGVLIAGEPTALGQLLTIEIDKLLTNVGAATPFAVVDPANRFVLADPHPLGAVAPMPVEPDKAVPAGAGISLGLVNGAPGFGPDFEFQIDYNQSFRFTQNAIPEPATAMLGLMGIAGLCLGRRSRKA